MGFLKKLAFWKKDYSDMDFELPGIKEQEHPPQEEVFGRGFENPEEYEKLGAESFKPTGLNTSQLSTPLSMMQQPKGQNKDFEIINAKLDAIKANIESINHRLENLERIARE